MTTTTHYFHKITMPGSACKFSAWFKGDPMGSTGSLATRHQASVTQFIRRDRRHSVWWGRGSTKYGWRKASVYDKTLAAHQSQTVGTQ